MYVEDFKRGTNPADKGGRPKDIFELGFNFICEDSRLIFFLKYYLFRSKINLGSQICNQRRHMINFYYIKKKKFCDKTIHNYSPWRNH